MKKFKGYPPSFIVILPVIILSAVSLWVPQPPVAQRPPSFTATTTTLTSAARLPIGEIEKFEVPHASGAVVMIPQIHRYPGSSVEDSKNNSAEIAQLQIYQILPRLMREYGTNLIMVEGYEYGAVPGQDIAQLAELLRVRASVGEQGAILKKALEKNSLDAAVEARLFDLLEERLRAADRVIALRGAPLRLKAEDDRIELVGSENAATRAKSAVLVRQYLYLQDRLQAVSLSVRPQMELAHAFSPDEWEGLLKILGAKTPDDALESALRRLEDLSRAEGKEEASQAVALRLLLGEMDRLLQTETHSPTASPSRVDNPYARIRDKAELRRRLKDVEDEIQKTVVVQRSIETATYMREALLSRHLPAGILQFGAGHEESLVKALNDLGLTVIVVTPDEVLRRQQRTL